MKRALASLMLGVGLLPALAFAGDEDGNPSYVLHASIDNEAEGGAAFVVEGTAPNLPDGTLVHITLAIKGKYTSPIEAAFFQVRVTDQTFRARKVFSQQRFAPQLYWARVELFVSNQRSAIKDWIRRELGVGDRAKLLLAKQDIEVGSLDEQNEFSLFALQKVREFIVAYEGVRARAEGITPEQIASDEWAALYAGFGDELSTLSESFREFQKPYVVWNEQPILKKLGSAVGEISWAIRAYGKGTHSRAQKVLAKSQGTLARLKSEVDTRLPAPDDPTGALRPPGESTETSDVGDDSGDGEGDPDKDEFEFD